MKSSQYIDENPFGEYMPSNPLQRQSVPECGNHERAILGYLTLIPVCDALLISNVLHPKDLQFPLHAAIYRRIVIHARAGRMVVEAVTNGVDRWLTTDIGYVNPRRYLGFCIEIACDNNEEAMVCVEWIQECAARRRRFEALRKALEMVTNLDKPVEQIDRAIDALNFEARKVNQGLSVSKSTTAIPVAKSSTVVPYNQNPRYELKGTNTGSPSHSSVK